MARYKQASRVLLAVLAIPIFALDPPPEFTAAGVVRGIERTQTLVPGADGMSICGRNLGPNQGCAADPDPKLRETPNLRDPVPEFANLSVYPKELCGVQVWIGDKAAGLLYVSAKQINFKIPQDSAETGTVDLRVLYQGQPSAPVSFKAGFERTSVSLDGPAYTNMPVWLKVELPLRLGKIYYPFVVGPAGFGCNQVEVRRDGQLLPTQPGSNWDRYGGVVGGNICGSYALPAGPRTVDRLPLHLLYRFDAPGAYEVRYTMGSGPLGSNKRRLQSEWTPIEILPSTPKQRADWLDDFGMRAPGGPGEILSDFLPSVLGVPDDKSLQIVVGYLYHPNSSVRRYAMEGLSYWPEELVSQRLLALLYAKGPSDELINFLLRQPNLHAAHGAEIVAACLPFLKSDSPVAVDGALAALRQAPTGDPAIVNAMLQSAEHIVSQTDVQNRGDLLQTLASAKSEEAHRLLRKFVQEGYDVAIPPLASFRDANDLETIGAMLDTPSSGDRFAYLPELLYTSYGQAAVPYLKKALATPGGFIKMSAALRLMMVGEPEGFKYAQRDLARKGGLRTAMLQTIREHFPEVAIADDEAVSAFVAARAGN